MTTEFIAGRSYHRVLSQVVVRSSCNGVQLHQVVKVRDLPVHPFLKERKKSAAFP